MGTVLSVREPRYRLASIASISLTALLLVIRLADNSLAVWLFGGTAPAWFTYWYADIIGVLVAVLLWLNRHDLAGINVDRTFVFLWILSNIILFAALPADAGIFVGLSLIAAIILLAWASFTDRFNFNEQTEQRSKTGLLVPLALLPLLPLFALAYAYETPKLPLTFGKLVSAVNIASLYAIIFEELLFRGLLWKYLREWGVKGRAVILLQAFLF